MMLEDVASRSREEATVRLDAAPLAVADMIRTQGPGLMDAFGEVTHKHTHTNTHAHIGTHKHANMPTHTHVCARTHAHTHTLKRSDTPRTLICNDSYKCQQTAVD